MLCVVVSTHMPGLSIGFRAKHTLVTSSLFKDRHLSLVSHGSYLLFSTHDRRDGFIRYDRSTDVCYVTYSRSKLLLCGSWMLANTSSTPAGKYPSSQGAECCCRTTIQGSDATICLMLKDQRASTGKSRHHVHRAPSKCLRAA
jgi:hypothetical protein